jgi:hypothetical protein
MIYINQDTLSESLIEELLLWNETTKGGDVWASNQVKWMDTLKSATSGTILSRIFPDELKVKIYTELMQRGKLNYFPYSTSAVMYMGFPNSCVNWHGDYIDYDAMSIYLNKRWVSNWGGWFAYTEEYNGRKDHVEPGNGKFIVPSYNMSIRSTDMELHCTTPISPFADTRLSIQLFFTKEIFFTKEK